RLVEPRPALRDAAPQQPEVREPDHRAQLELTLARSVEESERAAEVVVVLPEPPERLMLAPPAQLAVASLRKLDVMLGMPPRQRFRFATLPQSLARVLADRLQHRVAGI